MFKIIWLKSIIYIWEVTSFQTQTQSPGGLVTSTRVGLYCPAPSDVKNGYRKSSSIVKVGPNQYYGQFEIACYSSFTLRGNAVVSCVNGQWSTYPQCVPQPSCSLDILYKPAVNVNIITSKLIYNSDNSGKFCFF